MLDSNGGVLSRDTDVQLTYATEKTDLFKLYGSSQAPIVLTDLSYPVNRGDQFTFLTPAAGGQCVLFLAEISAE